MSRIFTYEYDQRGEALLGHTKTHEHIILRKSEPRWKDLAGCDDLYSRAIYLGQGCWDELDDISKEDAARLLKEWGHEEKMQQYSELMKARHSVRQYLDKPIPPEIREQLDKYVSYLNRDSALNIQIIYDEPECFGSARAKYGKFEGCSNYIAMVGDKAIGDLEERCGYYGELLVLKAQELGLNTCWVALTHGKSKATIEKNEKEVILISLGYGKTQGAERNSRQIAEVSNATPESPEWFRRGVEAALLAPTAINQQKFRFTLLGNKVYTNIGKIGPCLKIDKGIVKCHFELGAGLENFEWGF